jgi:hypothetical protein
VVDYLLRMPDCGLYFLRVLDCGKKSSKSACYNSKRCLAVLQVQGPLRLTLLVQVYRRVSSKCSSEVIKAEEQSLLPPTLFVI